MPRLLRASVLTFVVLAMAACQEGPDASLDRDANPLTAAAPSGCDDPLLLPAVQAMFPQGMVNRALQACDQVESLAADGQTEQALHQVQIFMRWALQMADVGHVSPLSGQSLEESLATLFEGFFGLVFDGVSGGVTVGLVEDGQSGPEEVVAPNSGGGISVDDEDISGDTWFAVSRIPDPTSPGDCPAGFPTNAFDCYPLFYDVTVFPASNVVDDVLMNICVVETGPNAPPTTTVEQRLQIASPSHDDPGSLTFWPQDGGIVNGVSCPTIASLPDDWRGDLWRALGPFQEVFAVTPAYANPGRLGASIGAFTPFAPTDPASGPSTTGTIEGVLTLSVTGPNPSPIANHAINLFQGTTATGTPFASTTTDNQGEFSFLNLPIPGGITQYTVHAPCPGCPDDTETVTLSFGDPFEFVQLSILPLVITD